MVTEYIISIHVARELVDNRGNKGRKIILHCVCVSIYIHIHIYPHIYIYDKQISKNEYMEYAHLYA